MVDSVPKNNSKQICLRTLDIDGDNVTIVKAISVLGEGSITELPIYVLPIQQKLVVLK